MVRDPLCFAMHTVAAITLEWIVPFLFAAAMEEMQVKDMQRVYNSLAERYTRSYALVDRMARPCLDSRPAGGCFDRCFKHCVVTFRDKTLDAKEAGCVESCVEKYMRHAQRVNVRFGR